jgi:hypothetical protein
MTLRRLTSWHILNFFCLPKRRDVENYNNRRAVMLLQTTKQQQFSRATKADLFMREVVEPSQRIGTPTSAKVLHPC